MPTEKESNQFTVLAVLRSLRDALDDDGQICIRSGSGKERPITKIEFVAGKIILRG